MLQRTRILCKTAIAVSEAEERAKMIAVPPPQPTDALCSKTPCCQHLTNHDGPCTPRPETATCSSRASIKRQLLPKSTQLTTKSAAKAASKRVPTATEGISTASQSSKPAKKSEAATLAREAPSISVEEDTSRLLLEPDHESDTHISGRSDSNEATVEENGAPAICVPSSGWSLVRRSSRGAD